jgi:chromosome partitioning protein
MAKCVDHIIIDGPPRVAGLMRSALLAADLVLIPVQPSPLDGWASEMLALLGEARIYRPELVARFVLNLRRAHRPRPRDGRDAGRSRPGAPRRHHRPACRLCRRGADGPLVAERDDATAARESRRSPTNSLRLPIGRSAP